MISPYPFPNLLFMSLTYLQQTLDILRASHSYIFALHQVNSLFYPALVYTRVILSLTVDHLFLSLVHYLSEPLQVVMLHQLLLLPFH